MGRDSSVTHDVGRSPTNSAASRPESLRATTSTTAADDLRYDEVAGVDIGRQMIADGFAIARYDRLDRYPRQADFRILDAATPAACRPARRLPDRPVNRAPTCE